MGLLIIFMQKAIGQGIGILYGALGEILTEKSGNLNLGIPGMMYMGGIAGLIGAFLYENSSAAPNGAGSSYFFPVRIFMCGLRRLGLQCADHYLTCQPECNRSGTYYFRCWLRQFLWRFSFQAGRGCWTDLCCSDWCGF